MRFDPKQPLLLLAQSPEKSPNAQLLQNYESYQYKRDHGPDDHKDPDIGFLVRHPQLSCQEDQ
jgi:hypothetical protein